MPDESRAARWTATFVWLLLVVGCALPMAWTMVSTGVGVPFGIGLVAGALVWTWAMVAFERRAVRRGVRAARGRLRGAAVAFAIVQGIVAFARPGWLSVLYFPAAFLSGLGFPLMLLGSAGGALAIVLAGGLEVFLIVSSLAGMAWFRLGWRTTFD